MKRSALALAGALFLLGAPARADDTDTARTFFNAGAQAYSAGKYADAVRSFEQAYALAPRPTVLFSLAQAERKDFLDRGDPLTLRHAIDHYKAYLDAVPSGGRRSEALESKAELEGRLARLDPRDAAVTQPASIRKPRVTVFSPTPGAQVSIDGGAPSDLPYFADLEPGKHKVRVFGDGYFDMEQEISGDKGIDVPVDLALREKPALVTIQLAQAADVFVDGHLVAQTPLNQPLEVPSGTHVIAIGRNGDRPWSREVTLERAKPFTLAPSLQASGQRVLAITMLAGGGALVGIGALAGVVSLAAQGQARDIEARRAKHPITDDERQRHNKAIDDRDAFRTTAIAFGATGAAIVTGGVLFYLFDRPPIALVPPRTVEPAQRPALDVADVRLTPAIGPGLYGAGLTGSF